MSGNDSWLPSGWPRWIRAATWLIAAFTALWIVLALFYAAARGAFCNPFALTCLGSTRRVIGNFILLTWLSEYQTLVGSVIAFLAALGTIIFLHRQIARADDNHQSALKQAEEHRLDEIARDHRAIRAVLPLALSRFIDYAEEVAALCAFLLRGDDQSLHRGSAGPAGFSMEGDGGYPKVPSETIDVMRDFIRTLDKTPAESAAQLLANVQVLQSLLRTNHAESFNTDGARRDSVEMLVIRAAEIYRHAETLFDYARFETETFPLNFVRDDVKKIVRRLAQRHSELNAIVDHSHFEKGQKPVLREGGKSEGSA